MDKLVMEARQVFGSERVFAADDFKSFTIPRRTN